MPNEVFLKPSSKDVRVKNPATGKALPDEGASVSMNTYWSRRMRDGDVVAADAPVAKSTATAVAKN